jgi:hypothetical protein
MARIRSVHPKLLTDEAWVALTDKAKWFLIGLWMECDDAGNFEWKPLTLKMRIMPADNGDVLAILQELLAADFIHPYEANGKRYGHARNFTRFQKPRRPHVTCPACPSAEVIPDNDGNDDAVGEGEDIGGEGDGEEPPKPNKPSKRVRSLDDVVVDEEAAEIVKGKGVDAFAELPRYRDHYRSRGKVLKDYRAGFHNWLRKAIDFKNERDPPKPAAASQANAKSDYEQWRDLLASYVPGKFWPSNRGARPESGYCDAPEDLLTEWKRRLERAA